MTGSDVAATECSPSLAREALSYPFRMDNPATVYIFPQILSVRLSAAATIPRRMEGARLPRDVRCNRGLYQVDP
jgi:hypothetical protein